MNIKEFLSTHDLISIGGIEKKLKLTVGTLRIKRNVPDKYQVLIANLLKDYGYNDKATVQDVQVIEPIIESIVEPIPDITRSVEQLIEMLNDPLIEAKQSTISIKPIETTIKDIKLIKHSKTVTESKEVKLLCGNRNLITVSKDIPDGSIIKIDNILYIVKDSYLFEKDNEIKGIMFKGHLKGILI